MNDRGHWELVSPLPDCPAGTKAERWLAADAFGPERWIFDSGLGNPHVCTLPEMRRNPAIFRWVPEPERVEWPEPDMVSIEPLGYTVRIRCEDGVDCCRTSNAIRAVLQALREGKMICAANRIDDNRFDALSLVQLVRPDGSRP